MMPSEPRELPVKFAKRLDVNGVGLLSGVVRTKPAFFTGAHDCRMEAAALGQIDALRQRSLFVDSVSTVLRGIAQPEVRNAIIRLVAIDVVDQTIRPLAICEEPCKAMPLIFPLPEMHVAVASIVEMVRSAAELAAARELGQLDTTENAGIGIVGNIFADFVRWASSGTALGVTGKPSRFDKKAPEAGYAGGLTFELPRQGER